MLPHVTLSWGQVLVIFFSVNMRVMFRRVLMRDTLWRLNYLPIFLRSKGIGEICFAEKKLFLPLMACGP